MLFTSVHKTDNEAYFLIHHLGNGKNPDVVRDVIFSLKDKEFIKISVNITKWLNDVNRELNAVNSVNKNIYMRQYFEDTKSILEKLLGMIDNRVSY